MHRLETLSAPLMAALSRLAPADRQAACVAACEAAFQEVRPTLPAFVDAMTRLRESRGLPAPEAAVLRSATEAADDEYLDLQDEAEDDPAKAPRALARFSEARLGSALAAAFAAQGAEQAADSVHEALSARQDPSAAARAWR